MALSRADLIKKIEGTDPLTADDLLAGIALYNEEAPHFLGERTALMQEVNELHDQMYGLASTKEAQEKLPEKNPAFYASLADLRKKTASLPVGLPPLTAPIATDLTDSAKLPDIIKRFQEAWNLGSTATKTQSEIRESLNQLQTQAPIVAKKILDEGKATKIAEYKAAVKLSDDTLAASRLLVERLGYLSGKPAGPDKGIDDPKAFPAVDAAYTLFSDAYDLLDDRETALIALKNIEHPSDSTDRLEFDKIENGTATAKAIPTAELAKDLVAKHKALEAAIRDAKEAEIDKLIGKYKTADLIPVNAFAKAVPPRNDAAIQKTIDAQMREILTKHQALTKRAKELLVATTASPDLLKPDTSSLVAIRKASAELDGLISALISATDAAAAAYDDAFKKIAKPEDVDKLREAFIAEANQEIVKADRIIPTLKNPPFNTITDMTGKLDPALTAARKALDDYLKLNNVKIDTDDLKDKYLGEKKQREDLLADIRKAIANVNDAIEKKRQEVITVINNAAYKKENEILEFLKTLAPTISDKMLKDPAFAAAIKAYDSVVTTPLYGVDKFTNTAAYPKRKDNLWPMQKLSLDQLVAEEAKVTTAIKALDDAYQIAKKAAEADVAALADLVKNKDALRAQIQPALDAYAAFNLELADTTKFTLALKPTIKKEIDEAIAANKALQDVLNELNDPARSPKNSADLVKFSTDKKITDKINDLTAKIATARSAYDAIAKKFDDDKKALKAEIKKLYDDNKKLWDAVKDAISKDPSLNRKYAAFKQANDDLVAIYKEIGQPGTDPDQLKRLKTFFDTTKADFEREIKIAQIDVEKYRADNVKAKFNRYVERIGLLEATVRATKGDDATPDKYKAALEEIERLKRDLEIYKEWMIRDKNTDQAQKAQEQIVRLEALIIKLNSTTANLDVYLFGVRGILVNDVDPTDGTSKGIKQFEANMKKAEEDVLKNTPYAVPTTSAAPGSSGSFASKTADIKKMEEQYIKGFAGLDPAKALVGAVVLIESPDKKTVSLNTLRIKDGARVLEKRFLTDKKTKKELFDDSTKRAWAEWGPAMGDKFANISVSIDAMKSVLQYIYANENPQMRDKLVAQAIYNICMGKEDPVLRQLAKGHTIYMNGGLPNIFAQASMDFAGLMGAQCHDTRDESNKHVKIIPSTTMTERRAKNYRAFLHDHIDVILKDPTIAPFIPSREHAQHLVEETTPKLPTPGSRGP